METQAKDFGLALTLDGYKITKQIGVGARSTINLAINLRTRKRVAIKHVVRESADDDPFIAQVEREYEVSHGFEHPYLRKSLHIHRIRPLLAIKEIILVMEHVEGLPLYEARPNRLRTFLTIFQRVAEGLAALHAQGTIHTDIKPTNIMLGARGVLKIIDFGQACPTGHKKERIQGTPDYIAPEQVRRLPLDERTDVYNLGATMYWMLTSENYPTALQGATQGGAIRLTSADRPLAPNELNDKIPVSLSKLVMACCSENPEDRPSDMHQVRKRLSVVEKIWEKHRDEQRAKRLASKRPGDDHGDPSAERRG